MPERLTKRAVDLAKADGRERFIFDAELSGFGLRLSAGGEKSYIVQYRAGTGRGAPKRRITIGKHGTLTPDEARRIAKSILADVAKGNDPALTRRGQRHALTIAQLADLYLVEGCETKKASTIYPDRGRIERHIKPLLGQKRVHEVTRIDIERFMRDVAAGKTAADVKTGKQGRAIVEGGKGTATRTVGLLGGIFSFAVSRGLRPDNPVRGVQRYADQKSERFLSLKEMEALGAAIREAETVGIPWEPDPKKKIKHAPRAENRRTMISPFAAAAIRLLLFTGARLREILHLRWEQFDIERGLLVLPDSKTGRKAIMLNAPALAVLSELPRAGAYVIAGDDPARPRADLKKPWALISRRAGLDGVRLHDLRHSFASFGAGDGFGLPVIGKLLGHTQASTTQRYAHLADDPLRRASESIAGRIAAALDGQSAAEVVPLRRRP